MKKQFEVYNPHTDTLMTVRQELDVIGFNIIAGRYNECVTLNRARAAELVEYLQEILK